VLLARGGLFLPEEEKAFTAAVERQQATHYGELFATFRANKDSVTSVSFWGISDDLTWLDNEPVSGRNDHPLVWDETHEPKDAYDAIANF
jgi:endo-1,4-beta-xylanase